MKRIVSWVTDNRSELTNLGLATFNFVQVLATCLVIYMAIRHGKHVSAWDIAWAFRDLFGAGADVAIGVAKLSCRGNGKGAPTSHSDRAPFRQ
jgi:hypothetical protein